VVVLLLLLLLLRQRLLRLLRLLPLLVLRRLLLLRRLRLLRRLLLLPLLSSMRTTHRLFGWGIPSFTLTLTATSPLKLNSHTLMALSMLSREHGCSN
jgi:hypothetical protein